MAQLTWRNIDAPNISIRDSVLAGQQVSGAFDRLGQILSDRETRLRSEATDSLAATLLQAKDQDGLESALAAAMADPNSRINRREIAQLASDQRGVLQDQFLKGHEVLGAKGEQAYGQHLATLLGYSRDGNEVAGATLRDTIDDTEEGRVWLNARAEALLNARAGGEGYRLDVRGQDETERSNRESETTARFNAQTSRMATNAQIARARREEAEAAQAKADTRYARRFTDAFTRNLDPTLNDADARQLLVNTPAFRNMSVERQDKVLSAMGHETLGRNARLTPTAAQAAHLDGINGVLTRATQRLEAIRDASLTRFDAQNRPSEALVAAQSLKDITPDKVYALAAGRGMSSEDIETLKAQNPNLDYPQIYAAMAKDGAITDAPFFSRRAWSWNPTFGKGEDLSTAEKLIYSPYFSGGELALEKRLARMNILMGDTGDLSAYTNARGNRAATPNKLIADIAELQRQSRAAVARGQSPQRFQAQADALMKRLEEYEASAAER